MPMPSLPPALQASQAASELPLRDIHLPAPVGWWPPAPGWWLLLAGVLMLAALGALALRRYRRRQLHRDALAEYRRLADAPLTPAQRLRELSVLLRRAAISFYPQADIAGLTGLDWLRFLDATLPADKRPAFIDSAGEGDSQRDSDRPSAIGAALLQGPYQRDDALPVDDAVPGRLQQAVHDWLAAQPRSPGSQLAMQPRHNSAPSQGEPA